MARAGIISLAVSAFALAALSPTHAPAQTSYQPCGCANDAPGTVIGGGDPFQMTYEAAMNAPQLFRFPGASNKGCSAGNTNRGPGEQNSKAGPVSGQPQVTSVFPAKGAVVRPGLVVVRVTFDRPMSCDASFGGSSDLPNPCPGRWREVTISADRRSFRTVCEVKADTRYRLPLRSFRSVHDALATAYDLTFSTSGTAPIATIREALAEDVGGPAIAGG
jgi:hypothetical protein